MSAEGSGERTEEASLDKLRRAREDGQVAKSRDFNGAVALAAGLVGLALSAPVTIADLCRFAILAWRSTGPSFDVVLGTGPRTLVAAFAPTALTAAGAATVAGFLQTGGVWAPRAIAPRSERLDFGRGIRGLVSPQKALEGARNVIKLVLGVGIGVAVLTRLLPGVFSTPGAPWSTIATGVGRAIAALASATAGTFLAIGAADLLVSRWRFARQMRMSRPELLRDLKQSEGDPALKGERRRRAHEALLAPVGLPAVRGARAVIVNPTHIAVALRYRPGFDEAPVVVAKGRGHQAAAIRRAARRHGVPIHEQVALARTLHDVELASEIPDTLYAAVAEVLKLVSDSDSQRRQRRSLS